MRSQAFCRSFLKIFGDDVFLLNVSSSIIAERQHTLKPLGGWLQSGGSGADTWLEASK